MAPNLFNAIINFPCKDFVSIPLPTKMTAGELCHIALTHKRIASKLRFYFGLSYLDKTNIVHRLKDTDVVNECDIPSAFRKKYMNLHLKFYPPDVNDIDDDGFLDMLRWFLWKELTEGTLRSSLDEFCRLVACHAHLLLPTIKGFNETTDVATICQRCVPLPDWVMEIALISTEDSQSPTHSSSTNSADADIAKIYNQIGQCYHQDNTNDASHHLHSFLRLATQLPLYSYQIFPMKEESPPKTNHVSFLGLNYSGVAVFGNAKLTRNSCPDKVIIWSNVSTVSKQKGKSLLLTFINSMQLPTKQSGSMSLKFPTSHERKAAELAVRQHWAYFDPVSADEDQRGHRNNQMDYSVYASQHALLRRKNSRTVLQRPLSMSNPNLMHEPREAELQPEQKAAMRPILVTEDSTRSAQSENRTQSEYLLWRRQQLISRLAALNKELYQLNEMERDILAVKHAMTPVGMNMNSNGHVIVLPKNCAPSMSLSQTSSPRFASKPRSESLQASDQSSQRSRDRTLTGSNRVYSPAKPPTYSSNRALKFHWKSAIPNPDDLQSDGSTLSLPTAVDNTSTGCSSPVSASSSASSSWVRDSKRRVNFSLDCGTATQLVKSNSLNKPFDLKPIEELTRSSYEDGNKSSG